MTASFIGGFVLNKYTDDLITRAYEVKDVLWEFTLELMLDLHGHWRPVSSLHTTLP